MSSCTDTTCRGGINCCREMNDVAFCLTESQCTRDPVWQLVVILAFMFVVFIAIAMLVFCKFSGKDAKKLSIQNFAQHQLRMQPKTSQQRLKTMASVF